MDQPPYGQPPAGMPPNGPQSPPADSPPPWGGIPTDGAAPLLPPKRDFPWAIVLVLGFVALMAIGGYIYKRAAGDPMKRWEENIQQRAQEKSRAGSYD